MRYSQYSNIESANTLTPEGAGVVAIMNSFVDAEEFGLTVPNAVGNLISNTIELLKTAGIWNIIDGIYFPMMFGRLAGTVNWKQDKHHLWFQDDIVFSSGDGFTGNGTSAWIRCFFIPSTDGVNYTQDDAGVAIDNDLNDLTDARYLSQAASSSAPQMTIQVRTTTMVLRINQPSAGSKSIAHGDDVTGLTEIERTGAIACEVFRKGISAGTWVTASTGLPALEISFLGTSTALWSANKMKFGYIGASLGAVKNAALNTIVQNFRTQIAAAIPAGLKQGLYQTTRPMLTIRFDDGYHDFYDHYKTLFDSYGIKSSCTIQTEDIGTAGYMTWANIATLIAEGHEITLHGDHTANDWKDYTYEQCIVAIESCNATLAAQGITVNHIVPHQYAQSNFALRAAAARYFKTSHCGYTLAVPEGTNPQTLNHWNLSAMRWDISGTYEMTDPLKMILIKAQLDLCVSGNRWAIGFLHDYSAAKYTALDEIITYCNTIGVDIVTMDEAINSCTKI